MNQHPYNDMQLVKRRFFAMRNGVIADTLRRAGSPYHIIFGVNLPQIREIAAGFAPSMDLAERLWADVRTRESMMLAPWLVPERRLSQADALRWLRSATSTEAVDILCMACLRATGYASDLAAGLNSGGSADTLRRYAALRLMLNNLRPDTYAVARSLASEATPESPRILQSISRQIIDELDWLSQ